MLVIGWRHRERSRDRGAHAAVASGPAARRDRAGQGWLCRSRSDGWCAECLCRGGPRERAVSALHGGATATLATTMRHATRLPGLAKANVSTGNGRRADRCRSHCLFVRQRRADAGGAWTSAQARTAAARFPGSTAAWCRALRLGRWGALGSARRLFDRDHLPVVHGDSGASGFAEEESGRAVALLEAARRKLEEEKDEFEQNQTRFSERGEFFRASLASIDDGLSQGDPEATLAACPSSWVSAA